VLQPAAAQWLLVVPQQALAEPVYALLSAALPEERTIPPAMVYAEV
jgi:hypothetical protein